MLTLLKCAMHKKEQAEEEKEKTVDCVTDYKKGTEKVYTVEMK